MPQVDERFHGCWQGQVHQDDRGSYPYVLILNKQGGATRYRQVGGFAGGFVYPTSVSGRLCESYLSPNNDSVEWTVLVSTVGSDELKCSWRRGQGGGAEICWGVLKRVDWEG